MKQFYMIDEKLEAAIDNTDMNLIRKSLYKKILEYEIGMRMLEPRELYNAQGFPPDYIIDFEWKGKPYPKKHKVSKVGNSVPPKLAEAVIRANMPEWCCQEITTMFDLRNIMCV